MAVDEAILEAAGRGDSPPTLRLYAWAPPCLSLGYAQPYGDVDLEQLEGHGWQVVRRPTGGRAILHTDELTYAVIGPNDEPRLVGGVLESYQRLSQALLVALQSLNLPVQARQLGSKSPANKAPNPVCFEIPSSYEITVAGKKLIGSAQARRKDGVLQHGSLPLHGDLRRITQALAYPDQATHQQAAARLIERATTVEEILGEQISWEQAAEAFIEAFSGTLKLDLTPGALTDAERARAQQLVEEKYAHPSWTERV